MQMYKPESDEEEKKKPITTKRKDAVSQATAGSKGKKRLHRQTVKEEHDVLNDIEDIEKPSKYSKLPTESSESDDEVPVSGEKWSKYSLIANKEPVTSSQESVFNYFDRRLQTAKQEIESGEYEWPAAPESSQNVMKNIPFSQELAEAGDPVMGNKSPPSSPFYISTNSIKELMNAGDDQQQSGSSSTHMHTMLQRAPSHSSAQMRKEPISPNFRLKAVFQQYINQIPDLKELCQESGLAGLSLLHLLDFVSKKTMEVGCPLIFSGWLFDEPDDDDTTSEMPVCNSGNASPE